jgi:sugar phosphate isomerase/epimerase
MKISCLPVSFFDDIISGKMTLGNWLDIAFEAGLDGIDISINFIKNHNPVYLKEIKKELQSRGMPLVMVTAYPDFTHPDNMQRKRELEYFKSDIALSSELGAKYLRILAGQAHPQTTEGHGIGLAIENLRKAAETAADYGVMLLYENHSKPGSWDYTDFSGPSHIFLKIAEGIRDTGIRINFDTANPIALGEEVMPLLQQVIDDVETIHVADTSTKGRLNHVLIGTGLVPFRKVFSFLKKNGFDGWLCIEENSGMGIEGVKRSVEYVRKMWREA